MEIDCLVSVFFGYLKAKFKGVAALLYKAVVCPEFCLMTKESFLKNAGVLLKGKNSICSSLLKLISFCKFRFCLVLLLYGV